MTRAAFAALALWVLTGASAFAASPGVTLIDPNNNYVGTAGNPLVTSSSGGSSGSTTVPDVASSGTIAAGTAGSSFVVPVNDRGTVRFNIVGLSGTGATLQAQYTADGTVYEPIAILRPPLTYGTTVTADGQYEVKASAASAIRLVVTVAGSAGTINVSALATQLQGLVGIVGNLPPGTNTIGAVNQAGAPWSISGTVAQGAAGAAPWLVSWSGQSVAVSSLPSLPAGSNVIGAVTQSGGPWSVSGTVAATQSGAWTTGQGAAAAVGSAWPVYLAQGGAANAVGNPIFAQVTNLPATQAVSNAGTFAVQNNAATPAGTNIIGKVGIDQTTSGTTNGVVVNSSALPTGAASAANQANTAAGTSATTAQGIQGVTGGVPVPSSVASGQNATEGSTTDAPLSAAASATASTLSAAAKGTFNLFFNGTAKTNNMIYYGEYAAQSATSGTAYATTTRSSVGGTAPTNYAYYQLKLYSTAAGSVVVQTDFGTNTYAVAANTMLQVKEAAFSSSWKATFTPSANGTFGLAQGFTAF